MSLVWHIAKKDLRRMAWPVGCWLAFIVVSAAAFRIASTGESTNPGEIGAWLGTMKIWVGLQVACELLIGYLLAGALVIEDELTGTTGFWMTRPIGGARLLAAKMTAAGLLFVVAPVVALVPVWLGSGFDPLQAAIAAGQFAVWQGVITLLALGISALAGDLAQFLFYTIGLGMAYYACSFLAAWWASKVSAAVFFSRELLVDGGALFVIAVVLVQQFLTRRTARGGLTLGLALAVGLAIRVVWPWDLWSGIAARADRWRFEDHPEDRTAQIIVSPSLFKWSRTGTGQSNIKVTAPWTKSGFYMPVLATAKDSGVTFRAFNGWQEAGKRAIGFSDGEGPITWRLESERRGVEPWPANDVAAAAGALEIWSARATVLGEIPLQEGGELSSGATRTRIVGLQHTGEQLDGIFIEEHDATMALVDDSRPRWGLTPMEKARHFDCYVLVDRATRRTLSVTPEDMGTVRMNSLSTTVRKLFVDGAESWAGAVLIRFRIEPNHSFTRPFEVKGLVFEHEEPAP